MRARVDVLGAADFRNPAHDSARMNAEARAPDERVGQAEIAYELGKARHERHDARRRRCHDVPRAGRVDEFVPQRILP